MFKLRVLSALLIVPPVLAAVWLGGWAYALLLAFISGVIGYEVSSMASIHSKPLVGVMILIGAAIPLVSALVGFSAAFFAAVLGTIIWTLLVWFSVSDFNDRIGFFALSLFSFAALLSLILLRSPAFGGAVVIIYLIAVIAGTDIGAYFAGRSIGGPKLAPAISPNKTWAGLIGGTISAGLVGLFFSYTAALGGKDIAVLGVFGHEAAAAFAVSCLIAPLAQSGDLMESWIKRRRGVKDSGNLIPGHGGILDRVDGYLTAAPAIALIAIIHKGGAVVWP